MDFDDSYLSPPPPSLATLGQSLSVADYVRVIIGNPQENVRVHPDIPGTVCLRNVVPALERDTYILHHRIDERLALTKVDWVHLTVRRALFSDSPEAQTFYLCHCEYGLEGASVAQHGPQPGWSLQGDSFLNLPSFALILLSCFPPSLFPSSLTIPGFYVAVCVDSLRRSPLF
jgi:hypothetical protein